MSPRPSLPLLMLASQSTQLESSRVESRLVSVAHPWWAKTRGDQRDWGPASAAAAAEAWNAITDSAGPETPSRTLSAQMELKVSGGHPQVEASGNARGLRTGKIDSRYPWSRPRAEYRKIPART
jgi:hypothetical protein